MKTPKNIEIPNFEQKKNDPSLPMYEISEYPPPPLPHGHLQYIYTFDINLQLQAHISRWLK